MRLEEDAPADGWPWSLPAVAALRGAGLRFAPGVTLLVGENGAGKSTLVEAIAEAWGFNPEGGTKHLRRRTSRSESPLAERLALERSAGAPRGGFFLRAETMHGFYTGLEEVDDGTAFTRYGGRSLHLYSHGESFLQVLRSVTGTRGLYLLDEPESALSFRSCLALLVMLDEIRRAGSQVIVATHSPLLASLPGATVLEVGEWGIRRTDAAGSDLVRDWRSFLLEPERYLRRLFPD